MGEKDGSTEVKKEFEGSIDIDKSTSDMPTQNDSSGLTQNVNRDKTDDLQTDGKIAESDTQSFGQSSDQPHQAQGQMRRESTPSSRPKKKGFKKTIVFLAVFVLVVAALLFIAVKIKEGGLTQPGQKGEIVWWGIWDEEAVISPLIEEYVKEHPDVRITYVKQSKEDYRKRLASAISQNQGPDIFQYHNSWVPMFRNDLSVVPDSILSNEDFARGFYPVVVSDLTTKDGIVGIPLSFDVLVLYVNDEIFSSAARLPPASWTELRDIAVLLTQRGTSGVIKQSGAALGETSNIDYWPEILGLMLYQNRVDPAKPTGELAENAISFYEQFRSKSKVWDDKLPQSTLAFASEKVAMYIGPTREAFEINQINADLKFKTVPVPQAPKENPDDPSMTYATYWAEGVWEKSPNKDVAWDFLKYLSEDGNLKSLNNERKRFNFFGGLYPKPYLNELLKEDLIFGAAVQLAPNAKSWYLADKTYDGEDGINTKINLLFKGAVDTAGSRKDLTQQLASIHSQLYKLLSSYGVKVPR